MIKFSRHASSISGMHFNAHIVPFTNIAIALDFLTGALLCRSSDPHKKPPGGCEFLFTHLDNIDPNACQQETRDQERKPYMISVKGKVSE